MIKDRRFIDESFPIKEVGKESIREKNIRHGHISTLHIWWARRPLAASRATSYAALIPAPEDENEIKKKREFIVELAKWENSLNPKIINKAREDILNAYGGRPPRILDPFAGGGSIPLECLRLGCEVYAGEYNPVAVLILKCTLEYPQKYANLKVRIIQKNQATIDGKPKAIEVPKLLYDVQRWGKWVLEEAKKEIGKFYPEDPDGSIPIGYIWARTIPCQNPLCGAEIPLMRQFWLARKKNRKIALYPYLEGKEVKFKIVGDGYEEMPKDFDPSKGTISKAVVTCPVCGYTVDADATRRLFRDGKAAQRMIAVILHNPRAKGKMYRLVTEKDMEIFKEAEKYMVEKRMKLMEKWGIDPIPDEPLPPKETLGFRVQRYGMLKWGDLFNSRQKLTLITFVEKVRLAYENMIKEGYDEEYAKAVVSYLAMAFDTFATYLTSLARYRGDTQSIERSFDRQAVQMVWDYGEVNPFGGSRGDWNNILKWLLKVIENCSRLKTIPVKVSQFSAKSLPYPKNYFDAVFTDPPYYDNIPYAYLSDFFYVWLKRTVGKLYPDLFATPLTPKSDEIVAYTINKTWNEAKKNFEEGLKKSFKEIHRVLRAGGIVTIVYTHKSTSGWEALINSLLESGLVITASWPIHTEMQERLRARESAALASSIYFVAHKIPKKEIGWYNEIKDEIRKKLCDKLEVLWNEGISGADYFIAAIGSAIEIFGKYKEIRDLQGNIIRADKMLDFVRSVVTDYVVRQILRDGVAGELSPLTKFYLLWRWTYGEKVVHFDDARKLAQSVGLDLASEWNKGFIKKEREFIRVLGPQDRKLEEIKSDELIDVLHRALLLWRDGKDDEIKDVLVETGWGMKDSFYRVAQAISETLPGDSKEKKLLDGFLSAKEKILLEISGHIPKRQKELDEFL